MKNVSVSGGMSEATGELKTITIGSDDDNPDFSLCPGHVDGATFSKAHAAEGWEGDDYADDDVKHEWWTVEGSTYRRATQETPGAKPFTVSEW